MSDDDRSKDQDKSRFTAEELKMAREFEERHHPARRIKHLSEVGSGEGVGIHHLGLSQVIDRLGRVAESIDAIWPVARTPV